MCSMLLDLNLTKESTPKACKVIYLEKEIFSSSLLCIETYLHIFLNIQIFIIIMDEYTFPAGPLGLVLGI